MTNEILLNEIFNTGKLKIIIDNWDELKDIVGNFRDMKTHNKINSNGTLTLLKDMYYNKKKTNGVLYSYSARQTEGRMYSKTPSLQGCPKTIRHTISTEYYWDVDVKNCHPVILMWYCENNEIPCQSLEHYVNNRDTCLSELMEAFNQDKDTIKEGFLSIMNGGDVKFDCHNAPEWFREFFTQIKDIHQAICDLNPSIMKKTKKKHGAKYFNLNGSCVNSILCIYENKILQSMFQECLDLNVEVGALVFDGLMIRKNNNIDLNNLLKSLENRVRNDLGINISLVEKEMDQIIDLSEYTELCEKEKEEMDEIDEEDEEDFNNCHDGFARIFYRNFAKENVKTVDEKGNGYVWDTEKLLWVPTKSIHIRNLISSIIVPILKKSAHNLSKKFNESSPSEQIFIKEQMKSTALTLASIQSSPFKKNILESLVSLTNDPSFITKLNNESKFLIPIKNGKLINLKTLEIRKRTQSDLFSYEINVDYKQDSPLSNARNFINDISCNDQELSDFLIRLMGYFLTAETSDRGFYIFWGVGCNGKSTLFKIMKNILLQGYTGISKNVLVNTNSRSSLTPELEVLIYARLAVLSEIRENEVLDESNIKSLTGGDVITCNPKNRDPIQFVPNCKLVMLCNDKPKFNIDDQAMLDRLKFIPFNARFEKTIENNNKCDFLTENVDCLSEFFTLFAQGANKWYNGSELIPVSAMKEAMGTYVEEQDVIQQWVEDCCETGSDNTISGSNAWDSFLNWNIINGNPTTTKQKFSTMLSKRFEKKRTKTGILYRGISIKTLEEEEKVFSLPI